MISLFKGYSTINQTKKFNLEGFELVKQDFLNAINIRKGEIPGRPDYGSIILSLVFEPLDSITVEQLEEELIKIANRDPRLTIDNLEFFTKNNTILVQLDMSTVETVSPQQVAIEFDETLRVAKFL